MAFLKNRVSLCVYVCALTDTGLCAGVGEGETQASDICSQPVSSVSRKFERRRKVYILEELLFLLPQTFNENKNQQKAFKVLGPSRTEVARVCLPASRSIYSFHIFEELILPL